MLIERIFKDCCALLVVAALGLHAAPARAQGYDPTSSHITPFPEKDLYRIYVLGDAMADGIAAGLADALRDDKGLEIFKKTKSQSGFTRIEQHDWSAVVKETSAKEKFHVAIVMLGAADARPILTDRKKTLLLGSDDWKQEYGRRVDEFLRAFRRSSAAVYWVGLPVMKATKASEDMQMINALIREKVAVHGGRFIDTWNGFTDVNGQYGQQGPDLTGKVKVLRDGDGVHFSKDGYRKLAHFVERDLRRDVTIAKAERNVPLAGGEAEQRRVNPVKAAALAPAPAGGPAPAAVAARTTVASGREGRRDAPEAEVPVAQDQKADHARVNVTLPAEASGRAETLTIDIVRPAIPAQVIAHVTRRTTVQRAAPVGENVARPLSDGLALLSSVTTVSDLSGAARRNLPVTQTPHYKVMVKGEAMPNKPGRADDFRWPRDPNAW